MFLMSLASIVEYHFTTLRRSDIRANCRDEAFQSSFLALATMSCKFDPSVEYATTCGVRYLHSQLSKSSRVIQSLWPSIAGLIEVVQKAACSELRLWHKIEADMTVMHRFDSPSRLCRCKLLHYFNALRSPAVIVRSCIAH